MSYPIFSFYAIFPEKLFESILNLYAAVISCKKEKLHPLVFYKT